MGSQLLRHNPLRSITLTLEATPGRSDGAMRILYHSANGIIEGRPLTDSELLSLFRFMDRVCPDPPKRSGKRSAPTMTF